MKRRYNIFNQVHKALRGLLYDTALQLQLTDFSIKAQAEHAIEQVELVLSLFEHHARNEDRYILSVIRGYDPILYSSFEVQQAQDESLDDLLKKFISLYYSSEDPDHKEEAGVAIFNSFNNYISANLSHMSLQETEWNAVLWSRLTDNELLRLSNAMIISMPTEVRYIEHSWMLRCCSDREVQLWIDKIKDHAPDFVFQSLLELAERLLPEHRWNKIQEGLSEGTMVA